MTMRSRWASQSSNYRRFMAKSASLLQSNQLHHGCQLGVFFCNELAEFAGRHERRMDTEPLAPVGKLRVLRGLADGSLERHDGRFGCPLGHRDATPCLERYVDALFLRRRYIRQRRIAFRDERR